MNWESVEYKAVECSHPAILKYLDVLNSLYANGTTILRCFEPQDRASFKQAQHSSYTPEEDMSYSDYLIKSFLHSSEVLSALSEVILASEQDIERLTYCVYGGFEFEGALTQILVSGGAYHRFHGTEEDARLLSRRFVEALLSEQRLSSLVFRIDGAWTAWYYNIAWDHTFVVCDRVTSRWSVLCATDTN